MRRILAAVLLLTACSSGDDHPAGLESFIKDQFEQQTSGQYGRLYDTLHPTQQQIVDRDRYDICEREDGLAEPLDSVKLVETYDEEITVPGTDERLTTVAATIEIRLGNDTARTTLHYVDDDGWRWFLADPKDAQTC